MHSKHSHTGVFLATARTRMCTCTHTHRHTHSLACAHVDWRVSPQRLEYTQLTDVFTYTQAQAPKWSHTGRHTPTYMQKHVHSPRDTPTAMHTWPCPGPGVWVSETPVPDGKQSPPRPPAPCAFHRPCPCIQAGLFPGPSSSGRKPCAGGGSALPQTRSEWAGGTWTVSGTEWCPGMDRATGGWGAHDLLQGRWQWQLFQMGGPCGHRP